MSRNLSRSAMLITGLSFVSSIIALLVDVATAAHFGASRKKVDSSREAVRNGALGILVDPGNPAEIKTGILEAIKNKGNCA